MNLETSILPIITLILNAIFIDTVLEKKKSVLFTFLVWFGSTLVIYLFSHLFLENFLIKNTNTIFIGLLYIFICHYLYKNNIVQIVFSFFSIWTISSMFYSLLLYMVHLHFHFLKSQDHVTLRILLYVLVYSGIIFYCKTKLVSSIKKSLALFNTKWTIFILFPLISFTSFVLFRIYSNNAVTYYTYIIAILDIFMVVFTYFLIFSISGHISEKFNAEEKLKVSLLHQSLQKDYYLELRKNISEISMIRHDVHHHLIYIQSLLKQENFIELDNYINTLISQESRVDLDILCDNSSVNAIVSHYIRRAKRLKIKVNTQLSIPENINIDSQDINVILGNSLENAIEACLKLTDENKRFLNIKSGIVNNYFVINIENSFDGIINIQNNSICSTKEISENHGIGLNSIRNITEQYKGTMNVEYTQDKFTISAILYNASEKPI